MAQRYNRRRAMKALALIAAMATMAGCGTPAPSPNPPNRTKQPDKPLTDRAMELAHHQNRFGWRVATALTAEAPGENFFMSPSSIAEAFGMATLGASGKTLAEMSPLVFPQDGPMAVKELGASRNRTIKDLQLLSANSIWIRDGLQVLESYLQSTKKEYGAEIRYLDFGDPNAPNVINAWIAQATKNKIEKMIESIPDAMGLYLINAVYFKAAWQDKFDPVATRPMPFTKLDGKSTEAQMMSRSSRLPYFENERLQMVQIPYADGSVAAVFVLPKGDRDPRSLISAFAKEEDDLYARMRPNQGRVRIPRHKIEYEANLIEAMKSLGMKQAFVAGEADFSRIRSQKDLFIMEARHKAVIETNEEGSEAAAVTEIGIGVTSAPVGQPFDFLADRPFLFVIRDLKSGSNLFVGIVYSP